MVKPERSACDNGGQGGRLRRGCALLGAPRGGAALLAAEGEEQGRDNAEGGGDMELAMPS